MLTDLLLPLLSRSTYNPDRESEKATAAATCPQVLRRKLACRRRNGYDKSWMFLDIEGEDGHGGGLSSVVVAGDALSILPEELLGPRQETAI